MSLMALLSRYNMCKVIRNVVGYAYIKTSAGLFERALKLTILS